jgi:hypothetical protein
MVEEIDDAPPLPEPEPRPVGLGYVGSFATPGNPPAVSADLLNARVFERFPDLRIALSEGGIGWIPDFLEQADFHFRHHSPWTGQSFGGKLPSDIFKEHIFGCFIEGKAGIEARKLLNIDMIGWESDYPHSDGVWPNGPEILAHSLEGVSLEEVRKVTHENAARLYQFDPFIRRSPDACTVKALRAEVADWDTSTEWCFKHRTSVAPAATAYAQSVADRGGGVPVAGSAAS